jgi:microcin C transport system substrate-binding protein
MQRTPTQAKVIAKTKPRDGSWFAWTLGITLIAVLALISGMARAEDKIISSHGYSFYGDLSYPVDYPHFNYVNPDAPKGGEISLGVLGTFDSMHPYTRKGRGAALSTVMYESLLGEGVNQTPVPADVDSEYYGLLAERIEYDEGKNWVVFYMRPEARFSDGTPVTAHDIEFSHNLLLDEGLKSYADAVRKRIPKVEVLDDHTIKFYFTEGLSRRSMIEQVGGVPAWSKKWYEETDSKLDESRLEVSPGSGPYVIDTVDVNRRVIYQRDDNYWGKDLPFNVGRNNFDKIRIEYFGDDTAAFEAFKAGEYAFKVENDSKKWATGYDFPKVRDGSIKLENLPDGLPADPSGIIFHLGSMPLKDLRVRQALALMFNFEWTNESLQYSLFKHRASFAQDTVKMAKGVPEGAELAFLKGLGDVVPQALFDEPVVVPHTSKPERLLDRRNVRAASKLLDAAGWAVGDDGIRRNDAGEVLKLTFLFNSSSPSTLTGVLQSYVSNVEKLGIDITFEKVDPSQYTSRRRDRDYDLIYFDTHAALSGTGTGLSQQYGSETAAYSLFNPSGLASPLVDAIIEGSLRAKTKEEEDASLMALDRALRQAFFMIPLWFKSDYWVAYYDQYGRPDPLPTFARGYLDFWWYDQDKADALRASGVLR